MNNWDDLLTPPGVAAPSPTEEVDRMYAQVFGTKSGRKLLTHLRAQTIEQPTWYPGEDASHGYAREGQNSLVREIERRIIRARNFT